MIAVLADWRRWSAISSAPAPSKVAAGHRSAGSTWAAPPPKLTAAQKTEARRRPAQGATFAELARSYEVGESTISRPVAWPVLPSRSKTLVEDSKDERRMSFDLKEIFECSRCKHDKRVFKRGFMPAPKNNYYAKHPPIGCGRQLFFVNINPRSTSNEPMDWAMESLENFEEFSTNRYKDEVYIPTNEEFYEIHHSICKAIFPKNAFEDVAIVHELYLCATTPKATRDLPWRSPCAERYMWRHLQDACPKLVVAFGERVAKFLKCDYRGDRVLGELGNGARLISLPHSSPRAWPALRNADVRERVSDWVRRCFAVVGTSDPLPTRDFDDGARGQRTVDHRGFSLVNPKSGKRQHGYEDIALPSDGAITLLREPAASNNNRGREYYAKLRDGMLVRDVHGVPRAYLRFFVYRQVIAVAGATRNSDGTVL
jgi:hypothetical protein